MERKNTIGFTVHKLLDSRILAIEQLLWCTLGQNTMVSEQTYLLGYGSGCNNIMGS